MRPPVTVADLVANQGITCGAVRDTQQGFGQAHQGHAFLAGQGKFLDQPFYTTATTLGAQGFDQTSGQLLGTSTLRGTRCTQQQRHAIGFWTAVGGGNGSAQHALRLHILSKAIKRDRWHQHTIFDSL